MQAIAIRDFRFTVFEELALAASEVAPNTGDVNSISDGNVLSLLNTR